MVFAGILLAIVLSACQKVDNDKIPPVIIIQGNNPLQLILGCEFNDPGIDVVDDKSDTIEVYTSDDINMEQTGTYYVNYTAVDGDSNVSYAQRKVIVELFKVSDLEGDYTVKDTLRPLGPYTTYDASVAVVLNQTPPLLEITNFNDFGNDFGVYFTADSAGKIDLSYNLNDTIINGTGKIFCDKTGFRLDFLLQLPGQYDQVHGTTFTLKRN